MAEQDQTSTALKGFIRKNNTVANAAVFCCEEQMLLLKKYKNNALHIDATGNILKKYKQSDKRMSLYHAIVLKEESLPPIPIGEMTSMSNTSADICDFLQEIRKSYMIVTNEKLATKTIVTESSFANINAILSCFQLGNLQTSRNSSLSMAQW